MHITTYTSVWICIYRHVNLIDCILTGHHRRLKPFKTKVTDGETDANTLVNTTMYTRPSGDDAIALATEDNISVNSTLAITFWDVICTMRGVG